MASSQYIRQGLIDRGAPPHIADAFVANFRSESGLSPTIREGAPNVHGTKGFGLYQLTDTAPGRGRETDFRNYARSVGADPNSVDTQLDFLFVELNGAEKPAARAIFSQTTTAGAAQAIVSRFLRPAAEHRERRVREYASLSGSGGASGVPNPSKGGRVLPNPSAPKGPAVDLNGDGFISEEERRAAGIELGGGGSSGPNGTTVDIGGSGNPGPDPGRFGPSVAVPEAIDKQREQATQDTESANMTAAGIADSQLSFFGGLASSVGDLTRDYFGRVVVIVIGIIFLGGGVALFGSQTKAGQIAASVVPVGRVAKAAKRAL